MYAARRWLCRPATRRARTRPIAFKIRYDPLSVDLDLDRCAATPIAPNTSRAETLPFLDIIALIRNLWRAFIDS